MYIITIAAKKRGAQHIHYNVLERERTLLGILLYISRHRITSAGQLCTGFNYYYTCILSVICSHSVLFLI